MEQKRYIPRSRLYSYKERLRPQVATVDSTCAKHGKPEVRDAFPGVLVDLADAHGLFEIVCIFEGIDHFEAAKERISRN